MKYIVRTGAFIHRFHQGRYWQSLHAQKDVQYKDEDRVAHTAVNPLPDETGPHFFFQLPAHAYPWLILAVHDTLVKRIPDDDPNEDDIDPDPWVNH